MDNIDVGKLLTRIGALLIIIAGIVQIGEYAIYVVRDLINYGGIYFWSVFGVVSGVIAIIFGFLILFIF